MFSIWSDMGVYFTFGYVKIEIPKLNFMYYYYVKWVFLSNCKTNVHNL